MEATPTTAEQTAFLALFNAQQEFKCAIKDSDNPYFKSKYADFGAVYDAVRESLQKHGIIITQPVRIVGGLTVVETIVRYKDGTELERSQCPVVCKSQNDPQAMGSAITYARRYSLSAMLCLVTEEDDDGNAASAPAKNHTNPQHSQRNGNARPATTQTIDIGDWKLAIEACSDTPGQEGYCRCQTLRRYVQGGLGLSRQLGTPDQLQIRLCQQTIH